MGLSRFNLPANVLLSDLDGCKEECSREFGAVREMEVCERCGKSKVNAECFECFLRERETMSKSEITTAGIAFAENKRAV